MNPTIFLASSIAYGVALGYLFTLALGHVFALWLGPEWFTSTVRVGAVAWVSLIVLTGWTANRWSSIAREARSLVPMRGLHLSIALLGAATGIVVADSLLSVVSLTVGAYIRISDSELLLAICLGWLVFGIAGAFLATRMAWRRIAMQGRVGTDL